MVTLVKLKDELKYIEFRIPRKRGEKTSSRMMGTFTLAFGHMVTHYHTREGIHLNEVSAGFISLHSEGNEVYGKSESLRDLPSRPEAAERIPQSGIIGAVIVPNEFNVGDQVYLYDKALIDMSEILPRWGWQEFRLADVHIAEDGHISAPNDDIDLECLMSIGRTVDC